MRPDDLGRFQTVTDPQMHPDGVRVAFVVTRMDLTEDRYLRTIWLWDGTSARPLSSGPDDSRPRWSPAGDRLCFLGAPAGGDDPAQVTVMPSGGGEAEVLTAFDLGAREAEWSPDGDRIAVVGISWNDEWAGLDDEERARRPRRIDGFGYRFDDLGWLHDRESHVYLADAGSRTVVRLTGGPWRHSGIVWRPDGRVIGVLSARHPGRYLDAGIQAWEIPVGGGEAIPLVEPGYWGSVSYDRAGAPHLVGVADPWGYPDVNVLYRVADGGLVPLTAALDRSLIPPSPAPAPPGPQWLTDGGFVSVLEDSGRVGLIRMDAGGSATRPVAGDLEVSGVSARPDGSALAFAAASPTNPGELWWWEGGDATRLTNLNAEFRSATALAEPEHFRVEHHGVVLDAWVLLPAGDARVPVLLNIHGGPAAQYGFGFFDEFQVYAGGGFGVVACNPRGSSGRGRDFMRVPVGRWIEDRPPDLEDVMAVLEAALERHPRLDPGRMGIMGGSYGGFLTARILAVDDRFRSAVPERGLYALTSFAGTSDIGPRFPRMYLGEADPGDIEALWAASPLSRAHRISTPCLLVHSEGDHRCPIEQAEQLFAALVANGVTVEMLRFPGGSHESSRSGKPSHRRERLAAILDWHGRHLE